MKTEQANPTIDRAVWPYGWSTEGTLTPDEMVDVINAEIKNRCVILVCTESVQRNLMKPAQMISGVVNEVFVESCERDKTKNLIIRIEDRQYTLLEFGLLSEPHFASEPTANTIDLYYHSRQGDVYVQYMIRRIA